MEKKLIKLNFENIGNLSEFHNYTSGGVYVFVYSNKVIYVGTAQNISNRLNKHKLNMKNGLMTVWYPTENENIYSLMCSSKDENKVEKYCNLLNNKKLWIPDYNKISKFKDTSIEVDFQNLWEKYILNDYMPNIQILVTRIEYYSFTIVESIIQNKLIDKFNIGYYNERSNYSWLGKIEHTKDRLVDYKLVIENFPILDDEVKAILEADLM